MSRETLDALNTAIQAHLADTDRPDAILTDWFIAYGSMHHDPDVDDGIVYGISHATSQTSPQGSYGVASLGLGQLAGSFISDDD